MSLETEKGVVLTSETTPVVASTGGKSCKVADVALRVLLLAASVVAVVVMVTSKQTELVPVAPGVALEMPAKFSQSPAFIYFVAALSVAGLYSIITVAASFSFIGKSIVPAKLLLVLLVHDVLILGIVASATGTAGGVAYIGLKGNKHVKWGKICNVYDKFCRHAGSSIAVALAASVVLVLLVILNSFLLYSRIPVSSRGSTSF